jgi:uncharacterized protein
LFKRTLLALTLAAAFSAAAGAVDFPKPTGPINDYAELIDASTKGSLTALIEAVEKETTAEIAVATVTTLDGLSVEEYAKQLFNAWGIGQKGRDNGVLLLVAPIERTLRIEVGYGLEAILPDGLAGSIMREDVLPRFQTNDYQGGIVRGVERIAAIIRTNEPAVQTAPESGFQPEWLLVLLGAVWVGFAMFEAGVAFRAKAVGPIAKDLAMTGPVLWFASTFFPGGLFLLAPVTAIMVVVGFVLARRRKAWHNAARGRGHGRGVWIWGTLDAFPGSKGRSGSSRGSSSSGSSSSGSSFGGGRSGGGGASGKW